MPRVLGVSLGFHVLVVGLHAGLLEGPPVAAAQQAGKIHRVGFLSPAFEDSGVSSRVTAWLQELGDYEGKNID